jgi:hypothetical protein
LIIITANGDIVTDISKKEEPVKKEEIKEEPKKDDYPVVKIIGFSEKEASDMKILADMNNHYIALTQQYEGLKKNIVNIKEVLKEVETNKISVKDLRVPYGMGLTRSMREDEKPYFIKTYNDVLTADIIKINALLGQIQHSGDSLGEQRMRVLRLIFGILENQHNFTKKDIVDLLVGEKEYTGFREADKIMNKLDNIIEGVKTNA